MIFISLLLAARDARNRAGQAFHGFITGAVMVRGASILEFGPESSAKKAGMHKGDVIIEYASERDVTIEKLSAVTARKGPDAGQVRVVFVIDGQKYSRMLPSGHLGISIINTTINVPIKSE